MQDSSELEWNEFMSLDGGYVYISYYCEKKFKVGQASGTAEELEYPYLIHSSVMSISVDIFALCSSLQWNLRYSDAIDVE